MLDGVKLLFLMMMLLMMIMMMLLMTVSTSIQIKEISRRCPFSKASVCLVQSKANSGKPIVGAQLQDLQGRPLAHFFGATEQTLAFFLPLFFFSLACRGF